MFVDLKEAYDRVDRSILLQNLKQLNVPKTFTNFLENYYFQDNISMVASGERTRPQYLSELSNRMRASGLGARLPDSSLVNILLFADDIIILGRTPDELERLREILEVWCKDFRMKVSAAKTNFISPDKEYTCQLHDHITQESNIIECVNSYKYLGVHRFITPARTSSVKGLTMVSRANSYKYVILRTNKVGKISSLSALWCNVALPAILYGTDVVPITQSVIQQ